MGSNLRIGRFDLDKTRTLSACLNAATLDVSHVTMPSPHLCVMFRSVPLAVAMFPMAEARRFGSKCDRPKARDVQFTMQVGWNPDEMMNILSEKRGGLFVGLQRSWNRNSDILRQIRSSKCEVLLLLVGHFCHMISLSVLEEESCHRPCRPLWNTAGAPMPTTAAHAWVLQVGKDECV